MGWDGGDEEGGVGSGLMGTEGGAKCAVEKKSKITRRPIYCKCFEIRCRGRPPRGKSCPMYIFTRIKNSS